MNFKIIHYLLFINLSLGFKNLNYRPSTQNKLLAIESKNKYFIQSNYSQFNIINNFNCNNITFTFKYLKWVLETFYNIKI